MAEFIKDQNMPDGSQCEPGMRFDKTWLIRNVGKLNWTESKFPVRLVCIAGNIAALDDVDCVQVPETDVNETASLTVTLIAPPTEGVFYSEWVLCCNGFQFGPRIWCNIQVTGGNGNGEAGSSSELVSREQLSLATSIYSEKASKQQSLMLVNHVPPEDLDDEFVVIPDCFDLDKKWKQQQQQQTNTQESSSKPSSVNLNDIGFHSDDDDDDHSICNASQHQQQQNEPESSSGVDLIMLDSDPALKSTQANFRDALR